MKDKKFKFQIPIELVKAKKDDAEADEWRVQGIASTGDEDLQGEIVDQNGIDISVLKAGRGLLNWDHQKGPENVLGQIEEADFVDFDGKKALMIKGYLFKHQERAKAFYNILKSLKKGTGSRVHMSIEGKILERDIRNPRAINKARVEKVALTLDPVNPYTFTELVKSLAAHEDVQTSNTTEAPQTTEITEENITLSLNEAALLLDLAEKALIENGKPGPTQPVHDLYEKATIKGEVKTTDHTKLANKMRQEHAKLEDAITEGKGNTLSNNTSKALAAGAGGEKAPTAMSGGEATTKESLESRIKNITYSKKKKKKDMLKSVIDAAIKAFPEEDSLDVARRVLEACESKRKFEKN